MCRYLFVTVYQHVYHCKKSYLTTISHDEWIVVVADYEKVVSLAMLIKLDLDIYRLLRSASILRDSKQINTAKGQGRDTHIWPP